jgi:fatty-acyl-CoA synthase
VAVLAEDRPEWVYAAFGAAVLGVDPVFLTTGYSSRGLRHAVEATDATTLIVQDRTAGGDRDLLAEYAPLFLGEAASDREADRSVADELERVVTIEPTRTYDGTVEFEALLDAGRANDGVPDERIDAVEPTDTAAILFTSGTTSAPKAVVRTHRNLLPHAVDLGEWYDIAVGDALLDLFPNPSISATNQLLMALTHGGTYHLLDGYDADRVVDAAADVPFAWLSGVDTMFKELLERPDVEAVDTSALQRVLVALVGGVDPGLGHRAEAVFDAPVENAYGMSETNAFTLRSKPDDPFEIRLHPGGTPAYKTGLRVDGLAGESNGDDEEDGAGDGNPDEAASANGSAERAEDLVGELLVKGITVTPGYDRDEAATEAAFDEDGWFRTGDGGSLRRVDGDYYFVFDGRLDDVFQVGGNNVSPSEVEAVIAERDDVAWAGVTRLDHDRLGAVPAAFVTAEAADVDPEAVTEHCVARLASYKVPRTVFVIEPSQVPTEPGVNGEKIRRDRLREVARKRVDGDDG